MVWLWILFHVRKWIGQNLNKISIIVFCSIENMKEALLIIQRRKEMSQFFIMTLNNIDTHELG